MEFLKGKKTYIVAGASLVLAALNVFHIISADTYTELLKFMAPFGLYALRSAMTSDSEVKKN